MDSTSKLYINPNSNNVADLREHAAAAWTGTVGSLNPANNPCVKASITPGVENFRFVKYSTTQQARYLRNGTGDYNNYKDKSQPKASFIGTEMGICHNRVISQVREQHS